MRGRGFAREARLTRRAQFDRVFAAPDQRSSDRYFTVLGRRRVCGEENPRLGMVVAKRYIPRAHERQRIKRIIRESFRHLETKKGLDLIVLPKAEAVTVQNGDLFVSLGRHWRRVLR